MTKDMPCQHVLYQSYLCYSSIIKIRLVFVSIYNSQYHFIPFPVSVSDIETAILQRLLSFHQIPDVMHIMTK